MSHGPGPFGRGPISGQIWAAEAQAVLGTTPADLADILAAREMSHRAPQTPDVALTLQFGLHGPHGAVYRVAGHSEVGSQTLRG